MDSINNSSINLKERRSSNVNEERYISLLLKFSDSIKSNNNRDQSKLL